MHRGARPAGAAARPPAYTAAPVNLPLLALAGAVSVAAVVAVSARDGRLVTIGLVGSLALGPLVADPLPDPLAVAARIVAATLAVYIVRAVLREAPPTRGSRLGWPAEAAAAAAAFAAGIGAHAFAGGGEGPAPAVAAGFALTAVAVGPLIDGRDMVRLGIGLLLLVASADLVRAGFVGTPSALEELAVAGAVVAVGLAAVVLAVGAEPIAALEADLLPHGRPEP